MCAYIDMEICTTLPWALPFTNTLTHSHTHTYTLCAYIDMEICTTRVGECVTFMCVSTHSHTFTHVHTHSHTFTHVHTHSHTFTHTRVVRTSPVSQHSCSCVATQHTFIHTHMRITSMCISTHVYVCMCVCVYV